jgi:hypothetical protein
MNKQQNKKRIFWVKTILRESTHQAIEEFFIMGM